MTYTDELLADALMLSDVDPDVADAILDMAVECEREGVTDAADALAKLSASGFLLRADEFFALAD